MDAGCHTLGLERFVIYPVKTGRTHSELTLPASFSIASKRGGVFRMKISEYCSRCQGRPQRSK